MNHYITSLASNQTKLSQNISELASKLGLTKIITTEAASELASGFKSNYEKFLARHNLKIIAFHLILEALVSQSKRYVKYRLGDERVNHDSFYQDHREILDTFFRLSSENEADKNDINRARIVTLAIAYQKALINRII